MSISRDLHWPRGVVFDCDGVLLESATAWEAAYREVLGARGLSAKDVAALNGASVARAATHLGVREQALRASLIRAFARRSPGLLQGARALLDALRGRVRMAVATNGPHELVTAALADHGVLDRFEAVVSAEQLARPKPAPDVYLAACRVLEVDPSDAVALEDSAAGVAAARAAGLVVIYVPSQAVPGVDADLRVPGLDDARVLRFLGLDGRAPLDPFVGGP
jgi:HAD superfamily hydrolase (TIGR01509 family)